MKKITLFSFAVFALSLASCKKERTCTCSGNTTTVETATGTSPSGPTTTIDPRSYVVVVSDATKKSAKGIGECMSRVTTYTNVSTSGGTTTTDEISEDITCTLK